MSLKTKIRNIKIILCFLGILLLVGCQHNLAPIADAGNKTTVYLDDIVYLDASMSHDPDGDQLEYQWSFSIVPEGSSPYLDDANSAYASFLPDMPGAYIIELRVFDGELYSGRDHVLIRVNSDISIIEPPVIPQPPIGFPLPHPPTPPSMHPPYTGLAFEEIIIQGTVRDAIGIEVEWEIINKPDDSQPRFQIINPNTNELAFSANKTGSYTLRETLIHGGHVLSTDDIYIDVAEKRVDIGPNKFVGLDSVVDLNFAYFDTMPPIDATILWSIIAKPELSNAEIFNADGHGAQFIPDLSGVYEISVLVTMPDGGPEDEDSIIITVSEEYSNIIDHTLQGECIDCHNGIIATGKSAAHIISTDNCESCHIISAWVPAVRVDHTETIGNCGECHNGIIAMGKASTHPPTTNACVTCHSTISFRETTIIDHRQVVGSCLSCHNNVFAMGKLPSHINTTDNCDTCHSINSFIPIITVDHTQVLGVCESCHNNIIAMGKNVTHATTENNCSECHSTNAWMPVIEINNPAIIPDGLDISIESSDTTYQIGELIKVTAMFSNNSNVDIELYKFADNANPLQIEISGLNLDTLVLNNPNDLPFDSTGENVSILKAGKSITREVAWDQIRFDSNGLTPKGNYTLEAFVLALEPDSVKRQLIDIKSDIVIEHPVDLIDINSAVLTALDDPAVKVWYENLAKNITCRLNNQVTQIDDYIITPIQTLVEVPKSDIQCHALLVDANKPIWNVYFQNPNVTGNFSYHVNIDAVSGELVMSMAM